jgi:mono/diheme cytochrome c family protein
MTATRFYRPTLLPGIILAAAIMACGGAGDQKAADTTTQATTPTPTATTASAGEQLFQQRCISCHQANGEGIPGTYPPLAGSEYAAAPSPAAAIRIVLHGIQGPITVKGAQYNSLMPAYGVGVVMTDEEIANLLTYVRSSFGNNASAVTAADVAKEREATASHTGAMTAELLEPLIKGQ